MGCGTGILAILASKKGAAQITAIDNDAICFESTKENAALNDVQNINAFCGSKEAIPDEHYDIILANINRNILLDQLPDYSNHLQLGGSLYISGFYKEPDMQILIDAAKILDLDYCNHKISEDWAAVKLIR